MEENQAFPKVDVHYSGTFVPNPLVYFALEVQRLNEDANEFVFSDFIKNVEKLIDFQCYHLHVDVYIDHDNELIFEWIQKEESDNKELVYSEEDVDSVLADDENCEHE
ncbi:unnamed protein product [Lactuca virosa]|uniref:Uncharacterized protein n=1 Tax=Lactuca virosa TaxID=75947 RepID=A0AAU9LLE4_9ASTR|nr:unnamed protein product [Lactuca virosa]